MEKKKWSSHSPEETAQIAGKILKMLLQDENKRILLLSGPLGSGKTTFVKGFAKALGIEERVKSPTYTYVNKYQIPTSSIKNWNLEVGTWNVYHFDLYRLPETSLNPEQTKAEIGLEDALEDPQALLCIEWPERLPINRTHAVHLDFSVKEGVHVIRVND